MTCSGGFVDITPSSPKYLAGYRKRPRVFCSIADPLEANAIVLRHCERTLIIVQLDVISVGTEVRRRIIDRLGEGIREEDLFLLASHTHSAPNVDCRLPDLGVIDLDYMESVVDKTAILVERILSDNGRPARVYFGEKKAAHSVNRRAWCWAPNLGFPPVKRVMAWHPNPNGEKDETVRSFLLISEPPVSVPLGVLWNYACHPVGFYDYHAVSADYPGVVRRFLRRRLAYDIPVIFLPGFAGNVRPNKVDRLPTSPRQMINRVINGPVLGRFDAETWNDWTSSLAEVVSASIDRAPRWVSPLIDNYRFSQPLKELMEGIVDDRILTYHLARLSRRFVMIGLSAEPVAEYATSLREAFPRQTVIPVGYLDGVCGYLPTSKMLGEGGLEVTSYGYSLEGASYRGMVSEKVLSTIRACYEKLE
ncbi:MAG: hypothetical protein ACYTKD_16575 [Planctomycetota bacterium]